MEEIENWVTVIGFPKYEVSILGNIRNAKSKRYIRASKNSNGYLQLSLSGKTKVVHRLVIVSFLGWSAFDCDHINGDKTDNRLINLRYCSRRDNLASHHIRVGKKSSVYTGVTWNKFASKWQSAIRVGGKSINLGYFDDEKEASKTYLNFKSTIKDVGVGRPV